MEKMTAVEYKTEAGNVFISEIEGLSLNLLLISFVLPTRQQN